MALETQYKTLAKTQILNNAEKMKNQGQRFVQILALRDKKGCNLVYSFMKDNVLLNHTVTGVTEKTVIPSISGVFLEAFVFENEIHDLFGIGFEGIAIDFKGTFYRTSVDKPMTVIPKKEYDEAKVRANIEKQIKKTPDLSAMDADKAAKVAAALAAKKAKEAKKEAE
ncbi:MAG: NADH-quinone oxidoreductase subunit C [Eggerthellaceae bacterium]|nr:NADH-quinone oxidoreductase subunit C [Eggerthellaceae bacterium]